jgi:NADPH:quinone reductase-like Zn-dependent oxidoreductase
MRALRFDRFGPPSVLQLVDLPPPPLAPDEALVTVRAAGLNPSDVKNVAGKMIGKTTLPRTPGRDFAGVVSDGPREWQGAAVWGSGGDLGFSRDGTHAEAVVIPVAALRRKPERLSFAQAGAVGTPFVTAQLGLARAALAPGEVVLVVGAAGAVGSAATQIARWRGATVFAAVRTSDQAALARTFGASEVLVHDGDGDGGAALARLVGQTRIDVAFDSTGYWLDPVVQVLGQKGRIVVITAPPDGRASFDLRQFYRHEGQLLGVDSLQIGVVAAGAILEALAPGFAAGALMPPSVSERPLAAAEAAYAAGGGKIVLVPTGA